MSNDTRESSGIWISIDYAKDFARAHGNVALGALYCLAARQAQQGPLLDASTSGILEALAPVMVEEEGDRALIEEVIRPLLIRTSSGYVVPLGLMCRNDPHLEGAER